MRREPHLIVARVLPGTPALYYFLFRKHAKQERAVPSSCSDAELKLG